MNPCKIKPERLSFLIENGERKPLSGRSYATGELTLNRLLAIAKSPIADYFYGMSDEFCKLDRLTLSPDDHPATTTLGEVAYNVGCLCGDSMLRPSIPLEKSKHIEEIAGHLELSGMARSAVRAFLRPLEHVNLMIDGTEPEIPSSEWKKPERKSASSKRAKTSPLSIGRNSSSYFESNAARTNDKPEGRLVYAFAFPIKAYYDAIGIICDQPDAIEAALRPLATKTCKGPSMPDPLSSSNPLDLLETLMATCDEPWEHMLAESKFDLDCESRASEAYNALYILFIRPFALIHIEHEPLKRYIELVNSTR